MIVRSHFKHFCEFPEAGDFYFFASYKNEKTCQMTFNDNQIQLKFRMCTSVTYKNIIFHQKNSSNSKRIISQLTLLIIYISPKKTFEFEKTTIFSWPCSYLTDLIEIPTSKIQYELLLLFATLKEIPRCYKLTIRNPNIKKSWLTWSNEMRQKFI